MQSPSSSSLSDPNEHDVAPLVPNLEPPLHAPPRQNDRPATPSIGRRIFRALVRFSVAVLIGVGATLTWQSYGDEARKSVRTWAPSLVWLLPVTTPKSMQQLEPITRDLAAVRGSLEQLAVKQEQMAQAVTSSESAQQLAPITRDLAAVRSSLEQLAVKQGQMAQAVSSSDSAQQLEPITRDLAAVRSSLEQLAVKQEQMAKNIATLQAAVQQDIKDKKSAQLPSQAVPLPQRKPPHAAR